MLSDFFTKTNELYVEKNEEFYNSKNTEIRDWEQKNTYYEWLMIFDLICLKLNLSEQELIDIYSEKYDKNLERVNVE